MSTGPVLRVARVEDSISHTYRKAAVAIGTTAGLIGTAALIWFTRGRGLGALQRAHRLASGVADGGSLVTLANRLTTWISDAIGDVNSGNIEDGARRTWTEDKRNARITDPCECADPPGTQLLAIPIPINPFFWAMLPGAISNIVQGEWPGVHIDAKIKQGSQTVFVEDRNASRITELTTCEGKISSAASRTWMGGMSVTLRGFETGNEEGAFLAGAVQVIDEVTAFIGAVAEFLDPEAQLSNILVGTTRYGMRLAGNAFPEYKEELTYASQALENANALRGGGRQRGMAVLNSFNTLTTTQPYTPPLDPGLVVDY